MPSRRLAYLPLLGLVALLLSPVDGLADTPWAVTAMSGRDAPLEKILGSFLIRASSRRHTPNWLKFLAEFGIHPEWPSAELLGRVALEIDEEQGQRFAAAFESPGVESGGGFDPTGWRHEEFGRRFAEVVLALQTDGFDVPIAVFVGAIEEAVRPSVTYYSDRRPYERDERESELFWTGAESVLPGLRAEIERTD